MQMFFFFGGVMFNLIDPFLFPWSSNIITTPRLWWTDHMEHGFLLCVQKKKGHVLIQSHCTFYCLCSCLLGLGLCMSLGYDCWIMSCKLCPCSERMNGHALGLKQQEGVCVCVWSKMLADNVSAGKKKWLQSVYKFWLAAVCPVWEANGRQAVLCWGCNGAETIPSFEVCSSVPCFFFDLPLNQCQSSSPSLHHHFCCDFTLILQ